MNIRELETWYPEPSDPYEKGHEFKTSRVSDVEVRSLRFDAHEWIWCDPTTVYAKISAEHLSYMKTPPWPFKVCEWDIVEDAVYIVRTDIPGWERSSFYGTDTDRFLVECIDNAVVISEDDARAMGGNRFTWFKGRSKHPQLSASPYAYVGKNCTVDGVWTGYYLTDEGWQLRQEGMMLPTNLQLVA